MTHEEIMQAYDDTEPDVSEIRPRRHGDPRRGEHHYHATQIARRRISVGVIHPLADEVAGYAYS